jgi:hypothetical protein
VRESEIADTVSELTIVGGRIVYAAGIFASLDASAAAGDAGLVAERAPLRRLRCLGATRAAGGAPPATFATNLRQRQRLQCPRTRPRPAGTGHTRRSTTSRASGVYAWSAVLSAF